MARATALAPLALLASLALSPTGCIKAPDVESEKPGEGAPKAPASAQEVLDRYVTALGGEPALRALPQRTVEARVVFRADEGCAEGDPSCIAQERVGQFVLYATADGRLFRRMVVGERISERGFDGKTGWNLDDGTFLEIEGPKASLASREDALLHWYLDIADRGIEPVLVESPRERGYDDTERTLDGVIWKAEHGHLPNRTLWFDRATGLLREEVETIADGHQIVIIYDGYTDIDGVMVPHEIRQLEVRGDTQKEIDILVQTAHHRDLREGLFDIPKLPDLEPEPDPYLGALDDARAAAEASPKDLDAQLNWARVAFAVAHFGEAIDATRRALKINPKEPEAMWTLARSLLVSGELRDAKKWLDKATKVGLKPQEYAKHTAWLASHARDWAKTAEALQVAGYPDLVGPYEAVPGKPLAYRFAKRACETSVPMSRSQLVGAPVVEATIDGKEVKLMLDTGTRDLILSQPVAQELLITRDSESPIGGSGGPPFPHGFVEKLELGTLEIDNVTAAIVPPSALEKSAGGVDGVLGVRPLLDFQVVLEPDGKALTLVDGAKRCRKKAAAHRTDLRAPLYVHETHFVYILAKINEAEGLFLLNTGMRGADVAASSGAYRRAGIRPPAIVAGEAGNAKVRSVSFGEPGKAPVREVGGLGAAFGAYEGEATTDNFRLDGMIGLGALGPGPIVLDFPKRAIYFSTVAAAGQSEAEGKAAPADAAKTDAP